MNWNGMEKIFIQKKSNVLCNNLRDKRGFVFIK